MNNHSVSRPQNLLRGVLLILSAALTISIQDVVFKLFSGELTLWQIFSLRGMLAIPILLTVYWIRGIQKTVWRAALSKWPLLRSLFLTMTFVAFYAAIPFLSLSTVGAANYIAPIFVALLSAFVIKEAVGPFGWIGVFLGFTGVVVLLKPGTDAFSAWSLLPILGAVFYALSHITTRVKCQSVPLAAMTLSLNLVMLLVGLALSLVLASLSHESEIAQDYPYIFGSWSSVDMNDWLVLTLLAGFSIVIGSLLAGAYQAAPPSKISTLEYSYLVFVAVWDILFFDILPTINSVTGMVLIVVAGLFVLHRNPQPD